MPLALPNSIFFHVPKAGGTFVKKSIRDLGIASEEVGEPHQSLVDFAVHYPDRLAGKFVFTFVRHPLTWWQSYWSHRDIHGWSCCHPMDRQCNHSDFNHYMDQILACDWRFHYVGICESFITKRTDFVGRQENLVADLTEALTRAGEKFDRNSLGRLGLVNKSCSESATYTARQKRQVEKIHEDMIGRFYPPRRGIVRRGVSLFRAGMHGGKPGPGD